MRSHRRWTLAATIIGSSMTFVDATVVNVALPALQADLHATMIDVQWVIEAYALFLVQPFGERTAVAGGVDGESRYERGY